MRSDPAAAAFRFINPPGSRRISNNNINGLVVSPAAGFNSSTLFYSPLTSLKMFRLETAAINDRNTANGNIDRFVKEVGDKRSQTDGLAMDQRGTLYMQVGGVKHFDSNK